MLDMSDILQRLAKLESKQESLEKKIDNVEQKIECICQKLDNYFADYLDRRIDVRIEAFYGRIMLFGGIVASIVSAVITWLFTR
ncbi:MAG: hypothetical protein QXR93_06040 [Archaeoglobaceae archaeon]